MVIEMTTTIKTLILEILNGNGTSHIKEIHLKVTELRPDIPQHTVRARLSEMSRSDDLEEKLNAFGDGFYDLYAENTELSSVVSYPNRGPWGNSSYRGNCTGHIVKDIILRFKCKSVFDPSEGSGTVKDVVEGISKYKQQNIYYEGKDLKKGWDIIEGQLPDKKFDMAFYHPPYWDIIKYSDNPKDLSNCQTLHGFEVKLNQAVERLSETVRPGGIMAVLIGDKRKNGNYFVLMRTLLFNKMIGELKAMIIKVQHNCRSDRRFYSTNNPCMVPIKHEYCLIFQKN